MNAVVTLCIGSEYDMLASLTHPTMAAYAKKIGAEFVVIKDRVFPETVHVGYEKFQLGKLLDTYERIIFLDTDVIVREDTPSLFQFIPEEWLGAFDEGEWIDERKKALQEASSMFQLPIRDEGKWGARYYNSGVMVFDRAHRELFEPPKEFHNHFYEQSYLNLRINRYVCLDFIKNIGPQFNRMSHVDPAAKEDRLECYIVHYAGTQSGGGWAHLLPQGAKLADLVLSDRQEWKRREPNYHIPQKLKISIGGGLGDQIDSEPVVREIRRLYPKDHIIVATHWPELYQDLDYKLEEVVNIRSHYNTNDIVHYFHTYAGPNTEAWKYLTHVMMHSIDFSSLLTIRRQLPPEKKEIRIRYREDQKQSMLQKLGKDLNWLARATIIHPGRSWRTKTVPAQTWNTVLEELAKSGNPVVVIGKDKDYEGPRRGPDRIGLVPVKVPSTPEIVDLQDKLSVKETLALLDQAKVLVSNDSAPIHLAGATDIWIVGVFTAKHPNFVLPFRKGGQSYKAMECNLRPSCWPCNVDAVATVPSEVRADHCLNYEQQYACHPSPQMILDCLERCV